MPNTDSLTVVADAIKAKLQTPASVAALGLRDANDVAYGDQQKIPRTPYICVETGTKTRELSGIGGKGRVDNHFTVFIMVYISQVKSVQVNRHDADALAEKVELILHEDVTIGGTVIHGFVTSIEPGFSTRSGELMRVARVTWTGLTKTLIA